ncbi:MAG: MTH938/NDUFAF3 family protein [Alphaproteobacteria bacterium]
MGALVENIEGRPYIRSYGPGRFTVGDRMVEGSVLIDGLNSFLWPVETLAGASVASMQAAVRAVGAERLSKLELLLLGCGPKLLPPPPGLRADLKALGIALEVLDTGAACRTFNVLLMEDRRVGAALIAL